ncbi:MAG: hypothetical protein KAI67_03745, partial [Candidatus Pacebacteria bacterium]|nr:hypothetical protein [Candidatus Paceibacterota bacterium]
RQNQRRGFLRPLHFFVRLSKCYNNNQDDLSPSEQITSNGYQWFHNKSAPINLQHILDQQ